jgi:hypothetical protein
MVSSSKKFVFLHIPKNAGTSIERALEEFSDVPRQQWQGQSGSYKINYQHAMLSELKVPSTCFVFAFVRNPWDRMVSYYHHLIRMKLFTRERIAFSSFVRIWCKYKRLPIKSLHPARHFMQPQVIWTESADFVGRFETLSQDFNIVCERLGIQDRHLPVINASDHTPYVEHYSKSTQAMIGSYYSRDIEKFSYSFGD